MADTRRTLAALQTLLADNTSGAITAQAVRDFLVSVYNPQAAAGGRLTLESGVPVSTTDQTAKTTLYYTPYIHDQIGLYDGASWQQYAFSEISLALGTLTSGLPYDVFLYDNAGTLTLELLAWTNGTTRATALALTNGVNLKTGALTRRYVGTIYTTTTTTTEDSVAKRFVFNANNRAQRKLFRTESTASWTYASTTWRQARATAANQVEFVCGLAGSLADVTLRAEVSNGSSVAHHVALGLDSTTAPSGDVSGFIYLAGFPSEMVVRELFPLAVGYHYCAWLEKCDNTTTTTFLGGSGGASSAAAGVSGLMGEVDA